jgi:predicted secreted protein
MLSLGAAAAAAMPAPLSLSEADSGSRVALEPGQGLTLSLPTAAAAGYRWRILRLDRQVLEESGDPLEQPGPAGIPGAPGRVEYRFRAGASGTTPLELELRRPFEAPTVRPARRFGVTIRVRSR